MYYGCGCEVCKYFYEPDGQNSSEKVEKGVCRRHPPRVFAAGNDGAVISTLFPEVRWIDWCGEFVADEEEEEIEEDEEDDE